MLIAILGLLHAYVGSRLLPDLPVGPGARLAGALLLALSYGAMLAGLHARSIRRRAWSDRAAAAGLFAAGLFSSLCVLTLLRDLVLLAAIFPLPARSVHLLEAASACAVVALALLATGVGYANARRRARVVRVAVPLGDLPPALHGFTIAQVSDVHVGRTIKRRYVEAIVAAVNDLRADLIAVTGDLVDGPVHELASHTAPLAALRARHGAFFVTGNHEYYSGEAAWRAELQRLGLRVLLNEHVVLSHRGATVVLAGVTDYGAHRFDAAHPSDPEAALRGAPPDAVAKILLAHQPRSAPAAERAGFHLQLSGHTHGGQFWPWTLFVRFQQPFTSGLHRLGNLWVYISRGTGYWGPPKRFGAPSEITLLSLVPAAAGTRSPHACAGPRAHLRRRSPRGQPVTMRKLSILAALLWLASLAPCVGAAPAAVPGAAQAAIPGASQAAVPGAPQPAAAASASSSPGAAPAAGEGMQEVDVTEERPGPGLWKVSKGDHVAWLLGTLDPLPKKMIWRSREVETVIAQAQEVLASGPSVSADVGPIAIIRLYLQYRRTEKIPQKSNLREWLPPALYARFSALKMRFDPHDRAIEELRPMFAARRLYERALGASQLTSRNDIQAEVFKLARRHHVAIEHTSLRLTDPRGLLTEVGEIPRSAEIDCLDATVARLETDLDAMKERAQAWALGDVEELRRLPYPTQREVCTTTVANSPQIRALIARAASDWESALEASIAQHRTTFAMKPIYDLIGPGGTLAMLRAKGYAVEGP